jgi:hypothetical protein
VVAVGKQFVKHVVPAIIKPMRVLWNEMIAFLFLVFGVMVAASTWRNFTTGQASGSPIVLFAGGGFALLLVFYGVSSLLKARKISRS